MVIFKSMKTEYNQELLFGHDTQYETTLVAHTVCMLVFIMNDFYRSHEFVFIFYEVGLDSLGIIT